MPPFLRAGGGGGVVAAQVPEAVAAGRRMLDRGGGAVAAALAAAFVETVALPPKCGVAGDAVALVVDRVTGRVDTLTAIGPAPAGVTSVAGALPATGGMAVGVPGAPAGYAALAARAGVPVDELAAPAVALAREGIRVGPVLARLTRVSANLLRRHQPDGCRYLPGGEPVAEGDVLRLPGLAEAFEAFASEGAALFHGPLGRQVAEVVAEHGGVLTEVDLKAARADWAEARWCAVGGSGAEVVVTPAPTYGPLLADTLATLAGSPSRSASGSRPSAAGSARSTPEGGLDADAQLAAVARAEARRDVLAADAGTSVVAAASGDVAVVIVHSNSFPEYGAGIVVPGLDLVLGNRPGRGFRAPAGTPGGPTPGARPPTTLHAWAVRRPATGEVAVGATSGGENQVAWNTQLLSAALDPPPAGTPASGSPASGLPPAGTPASGTPASGLPASGTPGVLAAALRQGLGRPRWARRPDGTLMAEPGWPGTEPASETAAVTSSHVAVGADADGWWAAADPRQSADVG